MALKEGRHTGVFQLSEGRRVFGSLDLRGPNSTLTLFDDEEFPPVPDAYRSLYGILHSGEHITLPNCVLLSITRSGHDKGRKCSASVFPNLLISGARRIDSEVEVESIALALHDAPSIFYDFDAFSTVLDPIPLIELLRADKAHIRPQKFGDRPIVGYFSGRFDIAAAEIGLGIVRARHRVSEGMGGPTGWALSSQIWVSVDFNLAVKFNEAMELAHALTRFFEIVCGREQLILGFEIRSKGQTDREGSLSVYEAHAARPEVDTESVDGRRNPGPRDVLICTFEETQTFSRVLRSYLESDATWRDSRIRLKENLRYGSSYTVNRIVSAANMFDILPASACPASVELHEEMIEARDAAREKFKSLPPSIERDSVLGTLGRIGKPNLKKKVIHRMKCAHLDLHFEDLELVLREAINCRNHYVHGSAGVIDYSKEFEVVMFFTDALEFVFGASDFTECGWDFSQWKAGSPQADHPFGAFLLGYKGGLAQLRLLVGS